MQIQLNKKKADKMAKTISQAVENRGTKSVGAVVREAIAQAAGASDWNTLCAMSEQQFQAARVAKSDSGGAASREGELCGMHMVFGIMTGSRLNGDIRPFPEVLKSWDQGCLDLFEALQRYVPRLAQMEAAATDIDVTFHYCVSAPFGAWFGSRILETGNEPDHAEAEAELDRLAGQLVDSDDDQTGAPEDVTPQPQGQLDIYTRGDNDQPTTCPRCGARTDWEPVDEISEKHVCMNCKYEFIMEEDDDEYC